LARYVFGWSSEGWLRAGREEPPYGWIQLGLDSYSDPDALTVRYHAIKVHDNPYSLSALKNTNNPLDAVCGPQKFCDTQAARAMKLYSW